MLGVGGFRIVFFGFLGVLGVCRGFRFRVLGFRVFWVSGGFRVCCGLGLRRLPGGLGFQSAWGARESEASKGGMKVGRIKDPFCKDSYFGITPPTFIPPFEAPEGSFGLGLWVFDLGFVGLGFRGPWRLLVRNNLYCPCITVQKYVKSDY